MPKPKKSPELIFQEHITDFLVCVHGYLTFQARLLGRACGKVVRDLNEIGIVVGSLADIIEFRVIGRHRIAEQRFQLAVEGLIFADLHYTRERISPFATTALLKSGVVPPKVTRALSLLFTMLVQLLACDCFSHAVQNLLRFLQPDSHVFNGGAPGGPLERNQGEHRLLAVFSPEFHCDDPAHVSAHHNGLVHDTGAQ